jgi:hypothetical protein
MSQSAVASASHSSLFVATTYEHACFTLSSTCLQLTGGDGESGEPGRSSLATLRPTVPSTSPTDSPRTSFAIYVAVGCTYILRPILDFINGMSSPRKCHPRFHHGHHPVLVVDLACTLAFTARGLPAPRRLC